MKLKGLGNVVLPRSIFLRMNSHRLFVLTIRYLQVSLVFGILVCLVSAFYLSFDPLGPQGLEGLIVTDLYGNSEMPGGARPMFEFMFLLFDGLSILSFAMLLMVVSIPLYRREKWAFWCYLLLGLGWPLAGAAIALVSGAHSYFYSVSIMVMLFLPPVFVLRRYI